MHNQTFITRIKNDIQRSTDNKSTVKMEMCVNVVVLLDYNDLLLMLFQYYGIELVLFHFGGPLVHLKCKWVMDDYV